MDVGPLLKLMWLEYYLNHVIPQQAFEKGYSIKLADVKVEIRNDQLSGGMKPRDYDRLQPFIGFIHCFFSSFV